MSLTNLEKAKICACIQYQINRFEKQSDDLENIQNKRPLTTEEYDNYVNCLEAISFYNSLKTKITNI